MWKRPPQERAINARYRIVPIHPPSPPPPAGGAPLGWPIFISHSYMVKRVSIQFLKSWRRKEVWGKTEDHLALDIHLFILAMRVDIALDHVFYQGIWIPNVLSCSYIYRCVYQIARAYPRLILEGGKMKKKFQGGQNTIFFAQKYQIFWKIDFSKEKSVCQGSSCPPLPLTGYALAK